jgi:anti-sigma regulatory factor (Ser/Thr protein kinase)
MTQPECGMSDRWPLRNFLELGALVSAAPCARLHARYVLWEWGLARLGDGAELLIAELVTNAVQASLAAPGASSVRLWLLSGSAQILILVWDVNPDPPARIAVGEEDENGRGLMLVEAISEQWGWFPRQHGNGKFVWAIAGSSTL